MFICFTFAGDVAGPSMVSYSIQYHLLSMGNLGLQSKSSSKAKQIGQQPVPQTGYESLPMAEQNT